MPPSTVGGPHTRVPPPWFQPWPHQRRLIKSVLNPELREMYQNKFVEVMHRRGGKDLAAMVTAMVCCLKEPGLYWHMLPTYEQGRKVIWDGIDSEGRRFTSYWPQDVITKSRDDMMKIEMKVPDPTTGEMKDSIYQVIGGDRVDRVVGSNPKGLVISEWSLTNPMAWKLLRPVLEANNGWVIFIYTPRGRNHGWKTLETARKNKWFHEVQSIRDTARADGSPIVTQEQFRQICSEEVDEGGESHAPIAHQEYMCSFEAPRQGSYFAKEMAAIDSENRILENLRWERELPVYTSWDLGTRDTMVVWCYQIVEGWVHWIDYLATTGEGVEWFIRELRNKAYVYKTHYAPHDVTSRHSNTGKSPAEVAAKLGFYFTKVPRTTKIDHDIQAVRLALRKSKFDGGKCEHGIDALREYHRKWDDVQKVWQERPTHNWASHPVDAMRTAAVMLPNITPSIEKPQKFPLDLTFGEMLEYHDREMERREQSWTYRRL